MAKFPIQTARQELGFDPSTGVRANIDVRQGDVGGAIGQALIAGGRELQRRSVRRAALEEKNRTNLDALSARKADKRRDLTNARIATMKSGTSPEKWEEETTRIVTEGNNEIAGFDFSPDAMAKQQILSGGDLETLPELALAAGSRAISTATINSETERLTDDFRSGKEGMARRTVEFIETMRNNGLSSEAIVARIKAAKEGGKKGREEDLVNGVHAAIEAGSQIGDFSVAKKLATNEGIPEKDQTVLRNTIRANESVFESKQDSIQESNTIDFVLKIADGRNLADPETPQLSATEINDALRAGDISLSQRDNLIKRLATPEITTNRVTQANLYTKSLDIWRGTTTKPEFDKALNAESKVLDDQAYNLLAKSGADTLKSSQAEALGRADTEAKRLLVEIPDDSLFAKILAQEKSGLAFDAAKLFEDTANEERQLQFWSLSRYNAELRQWITENPDKLGKDFFQFSESLKHQYWSRSIEEIRVLREKRESQLRGDLPVGPPAPLPIITTPAERDLLPKGTRYQDAEGNIATKQ